MRIPGPGAKLNPMPPPAPLVLKDVRTLADGWVFAGPVIALPEGLYFFVRDAAYEGPLAEWLAKEALGVGAGFLGGLLVKAAAGRADAARPRPAALAFRPREDAAAVYDRLLTEAPGLLQCRQFFLLPKSAVAAVAAPAAGVLAVDIPGLTLFVEDIDPEAGADRYLARHGYPVHRTPASLAKKASYLAAVAVGLGALAMGTLELYETHKAGTWLASKDGVRGVMFSEEGTYYMIQGRDVRAADTGWLDRLPLFQLTMALGMLVFGAWAFGQLRQRR